MLCLVRPGFKVYIPDGGAYQYPPASLMYGNVPTPETNLTRGDPDTCADALETNTTTLQSRAK